MTESSIQTDVRAERRLATRFIVLLGIVSLFADATYESARGILGPFLAMLGSTGAAVGFVAGGGELLNNGLRIASGFVADRTKRYWPLTLIGFAINMAAVPLLALARTPGVAASLVFVERTGKAIRNPTRDAMLAMAARRFGAGWCFGLQEALGQIGAVTGPLLVALALSYGYSYRQCFTGLVLPAALTLVVLTFCYRLFPHPETFEPAVPESKPRGLSRIYWFFLVAASLVAAAYLDYPLISYHLVKHQICPAARVPVFYAIAMGAHAVAAVLFGKLFDRGARRAVVIGCLVTCPIAPLVFLGGIRAAIGGIVLWGIGMGAQKAMFKAALSGMVSHERRGTAYGIFYAAYGVAWFLGSVIAGSVYDRSRGALVAGSIVIQLMAVFAFLAILRDNDVIANDQHRDTDLSAV